MTSTQKRNSDVEVLATLKTRLRLLVEDCGAEEVTRRLAEVIAEDYDDELECSPGVPHEFHEAPDAEPPYDVCVSCGVTRM